MIRATLILFVCLFAGRAAADEERESVPFTSVRLSGGIYTPLEGSDVAGLRAGAIVDHWAWQHFGAGVRFGYGMDDYLFGANRQLITPELRVLAGNTDHALTSHVALGLGGAHVTSRYGQAAGPYASAEAGILVSVGAFQVGFAGRAEAMLLATWWVAAGLELSLGARAPSR